MPEEDEGFDQPVGRALVRRLAVVPIVALAFMVAVIVVGSVVADVWVGPMPTLESAVVASTTLLSVLVGVLLLARAGAEGEPRLVGLSAGFLFVAVLIVGHGLSFPGVVTTTGLWSSPTSSVSAWLWLAWHVGFTVAVGASLLAPSSLVDRAGGPILRYRRVVAWSAVFAAAGLVAAVAVVEPYFPALVVRGRVQPMLHGIEIGALAITVAVAVGILLRHDATDRLRRWMVVALAAMVADQVVSIVASRRFTAGWYVTRLSELVIFALVLVVLLVDIADLYWRTEQQKRTLQAAVSRDALTGAASRQAILEVATIVIGRAADVVGGAGRCDPVCGPARERVEGPGAMAAGDDAGLGRSGPPPVPAAIAMVDLDHFKVVNDRHGHLVGDQVLAEAALRAAHTLRGGDRIGRYGGEEFLLVLDPATEEQAVAIAERVRASIGGTPFSTSEGPVTVTASLGVTVLGPSDDLLSAIGRADGALYEAKRAGRDRVVVVVPAEVASRTG